MSDDTHFRPRADWVWIRPPQTSSRGLIPRGDPPFSEDRNRYVYFRKAFQIHGVVTAARVSVSAGGRYQLLANGALIGRGPARCHPDWQSVDTWDVAPRLREGTNVLAALVHTYGVDTSWYELPRGAPAIYFGCGGFFLEGEVALSGGEKILLDSDSSWCFLPALSWKQDTACGGTGFAEDFDASREPRGWAGADFDASGWHRAVVQRIEVSLAGSDAVPFPRMVPSGVPGLLESPLLPRRIILCAEAGGGPAAGPEEISQPSHCRILRRESLRFDPADCLLETASGHAGLLVVDFGKVVIGRITLEAEASEGTLIELAGSETLNPDGTVFQPPAVPGIFAPTRHRVRLRNGTQRFQQFEPAGLRYLELRVSGGSRPLRITSLCIEECRFPSTAAGEFACSDQGLTEAWNAAAYTASVCRQDGMIDCPSREQRQWSNDAYVQALVNYVTEQDTRLVRRFLAQVAETQRPDGMTAMATTSDLHAAGRTFAPDFCLLWILSIEDYVEYTGDAQVVHALLPAVAKALAWFDAYAGNNHLLTDVPGWLFIDWSEKLDRNGAVTVLNALYVAALRAGARLALRAGVRAWAARWRALADGVGSAINATLWSAERGVYVDAVRGSVQSDIVSQHANSCAVFFSIAPRPRWNRILGTILDPARVKLTRNWRWDVERPFDPPHDVILAQPYFSRFLHGALAAADRTDAIVHEIRGRWLPMLKNGSTFWETWQLTPTTSQCHGFSAIPAYDLSTHVLGVRPLTDGFARFRVSPWLDGLSWAEGKVPTPRGSVAVRWDTDARRPCLEVDVPDRLRASVRLPEAYASDDPPRFGSGRHTIRLRRASAGRTGGRDAAR